MKRLLTPTAFLLLALPAAAFAREQTRPLRAREQSGLINTREQSVLARVTVYWAKGGPGSDRFTRLHKTATGVRLRSGHCAVDPRRIPYGSQVIFPDGRFLAVDTGTAVINRKAARLSGRTKVEKNAVVVDRFFETKGQAEAWEKKHPPFMTVRVILPNRHQGYQSEQRLAEEKYPRAIPVAAPKYPRATAAALIAKK
ncbi:MAG: hypothetical protein ABI925_00710 [Verrucomicrobiota bacterium]